MQLAPKYELNLPRQTKYQLSVTALLAIAILGWRFLTKSVVREALWFKSEGYWIMLVLVVIAGLAWFRFWRPRFCSGKSWLKAHWIGLLLACLGGIFFQLHEPRRYKVLYDEYGYAGISYDMHFSRQPTFPSRAHYLEGRLYVLDHGLDKRPVLFPFLISIVHDLTGYRANNTIYLNAVIAALLLFAIYLIAALWKAKEAGWIAQLFLIGLPLMAQCATGGGYDLANLLFLALFVIAATLYLRTAGTRGLDALIAVTVLLAQLRYESILMTLACAGVILAKWMRTKNVRFTWVSVGLIAFLFIPVLVNKFSMDNPIYFENKNGQPLASLHYFWGNLSHSLVYLYQFGIEESNSAILSIVGTIAILFMFVRAGKLLLGKKRMGDDLKVAVAVSIICGLNSLVMMFWFWSAWDDPMASRLSLVLTFAFILAIIWLVKQWCLKKSIPGIAIWLLGVLCVVGAVPEAANSTASKNLITGREYEYFFETLKNFPRDKTLLVGQGYIGAIINGFAAAPTPFVNAAPWKVSRALSVHQYENIIAVQRFVIDPTTMKEGADQLAKLSDDFVLQTISEKRFRPDIITRIVRIVGVKPGKEVIPEDEKKKGPPYKSSYDLMVDSLNKLP